MALTGCDSAEAPTPSAPANSSPTFDVAANTKRVCADAAQILTPATFQAALEQIARMAAARSREDETTETNAKAAARVRIDAWVRGLRELAPITLDPELAKVFNETATKLEYVGSDEFLDRFTYETEVFKAQSAITDAIFPYNRACGS
jgi:hypothetical protein